MGNPHRNSAGLIYGISAYTLWGVFPIYFRALAEVTPYTILCHRIVWSTMFLVLVVSMRGEWGAVTALCRSRRKLLLLAAGSILIALNWLIFIYAVASKQVLQSSLGYFINPLLSIALGMVFLREKLRPWQGVAVGIAAVAVLHFTLRGGGLPWIATSLAATFALYGLVRKKIDANSLHALLMETTLLLPVSVVSLLFLPAGHYSQTSWILLSLSGIITAVPLLLFGAAVRRLALSTVGFLQYIGPTLQMLLATWVFHEPLDRTKLISFLLCWVGIVVYVVDSLRSRSPQPVADEPE